MLPLFSKLRPIHFLYPLRVFIMENTRPDLSSEFKNHIFHYLLAMFSPIDIDWHLSMLESDLESPLTLLFSISVTVSLLHSMLEPQNLSVTFFHSPTTANQLFLLILTLRHIPNVTIFHSLNILL